ncbi:MAG: metallophosphoesterase [Caloramator sp.]|jgi:predicted phosphodiesterase|uniref:metallophosphoesterase n=1 Tax=Caloramator sp. TaxID=1871330 RepID=UPI001E185E0A|nr:metallophosphoesterase [Caloramator sp.]MBZ4662975.1 metallophosphoesterase [Caloramator sp.]
MKQIINTLYFLSGRIYVPTYLLGRKNIILHISDTPSNIYPSIIKLVKKINPKYIVHTGDIVDNIKLELYPNRLNEYKDYASIFINELVKYTSNRLIIVPGNHDNIDVIKNIDKVIIVEEGKSISIDGLSIGVSHTINNLPTYKCDFYLYGHDKSKGNRNQLNGINLINIIDIESNKVFHLKYPMGTDNYRLLRTKIGI